MDQPICARLTSWVTKRHGLPEAADVVYAKKARYSLHMEQTAKALAMICKAIPRSSRDKYDRIQLWHPRVERMYRWHSHWRHWMSEEKCQMLH